MVDRDADVGLEPEQQVLRGGQVGERGVGLPQGLGAGVPVQHEALAAAGGTCFFDMPLNSEPPVLDAASLRAKRTLAVSWPRKRKKGREMVTAMPSRFIAEMALDMATIKEDPREKLRALRAEFAKKAQDSKDAAAAQLGG